MTSTQKWTYNEFLAFVLLYASHVDIEYSEAEKAKVKSLVSDQSYNSIYDEFIHMSDYAALQKILGYKETYYPTAEQKNDLLSNIKELFYADGDFSTMEAELMHFLDKML